MGASVSQPGQRPGKSAPSQPPGTAAAAAPGAAANGRRRSSLPPPASKLEVPPNLLAYRPASLPRIERVPLTCLTCVSSSYDYTRSTKENYSVEPPPPLDASVGVGGGGGGGAAGGSAPDLRGLYGRFRELRARVDTSYHGYYSEHRQQVQDSLICQVVDAVSKPEQAQPWIVFTAGAMGAGKSRTVNWMAQRGIFPLCSIVQIDADVFKTAFPEWPGYVAKEPLTAGYHTRHESGYLVELAQEAALRAGKHVWVDGSLRDADWYERVFRRIRRQHPHYRIAILYVRADEAEVMRRAQERGEKTGRFVPRSEILDSLQRVPRAVYRLSRLATFLAEIDNTHEEPHLARFMAMQDFPPDRGVPDADVRPGAPHGALDGGAGDDDTSADGDSHAGWSGRPPAALSAGGVGGIGASADSLGSAPPVSRARSSGELLVRTASVEWEGTRACFDGHDRWDEIESRLRSVPVATERGAHPHTATLLALPLRMRHVVSSGS